MYRTVIYAIVFTEMLTAVLTIEASNSSVKSKPIAKPEIPNHFLTDFSPQIGSNPVKPGQTKDLPNVLDPETPSVRDKETQLKDKSTIFIPDENILTEKKPLNAEKSLENGLPESQSRFMVPARSPLTTLEETAGPVLDKARQHIHSAKRMFSESLNSLRQKSKSVYNRFKKGQPACSKDVTCQYSFAYAQQVFYPHHAQQVGPLFFKTPRKCQCFGVSCEASASGRSPLKFTELTENDASRLLSKIANLPEEIQEKLTDLQDLASLTTEELKQLPTDIIPALVDKVMDSVANLTADKLEILCDKLMEPSSHPRNLRRALEAGIKCSEHLGRINFKGHRHRSQSAVMMKHIRKDKSPSKWTSRKLAEVARFFGDALVEDDIAEVPVKTIRKSLKSISHAHIPMKSVRRKLVMKLMGEYSSPTMMPGAFLANMGRLLEDMNVQELVLLRHDAVANVAHALTDAGVQKDTTRITLVKNMARAIRAAPKVGKIAKIIPWLKTDVKFMKNVNITNLLQAVSTINVTFTPAESNMIAERLEKELIGYQEATEKNKTEYLFDAIARFADGFDMAYLESLTNEAFPKICVKMPAVKSRPKSKMILRKLKSAKTMRLTAQEIGTLFNGVDLEDVDEMSEEEIIDALPAIKDLQLPAYLGRKIVRKIAVEVFSHNDTNADCNDGFHRLGNLAKHVRPRFIDEAKVIPVAIGNSECDLNFDHVQLSKAQVYAIVDNIREMLTSLSDDGEISVFSSSVIRKLGRLSRGLTADDIQSLPLDTDLLSVIEILSEYEDDLDNSQIEAIVEKIREYFDIANSNELTDVDDITVLQIGIFLQYLNSDFELTMFPKSLRPSMSKEMGKSSLLKIPNSKRQALLKFALENTKLPGSSELKDATRMSELDENVLMDLGSLRCGLTQDLIEKLNKEAIEVHLEDIQACPMKEKEADALVERALSYNINILHYREQMATMGALLLHLKEPDMTKLKDDELAEITDYVAKSTNDVELTVKTTEDNGYIRHRSSSDKKARGAQRKRLFKRTYEAMTKAFGSGKCHELMRLGEAGKDVADLIDVSQLKRCIDEIGSIDWNPDSARMLLNKISEFQKWGTFNKKKVKKHSDYLLENVPKLTVGLSEDEMSMLNLTKPDSIAALGEIDGFTEKQLERGFNRWSSQRGDKGDLSDEDVANLKTFVCGASPEYIQTRINKRVVRENMDILGKNVRKCNRDKLSAYAKKLSSALGERTREWSKRDVVDMGSLLGGLPKPIIASLTKGQIKVIEPGVISNLPPEKVKDFTEEQLGHMTANQVSAITSMQRSYMSQEQMDAIGIEDIINGGVSVKSFNYTALTIVLASLRQVLIFIAF